MTAGNSNNNENPTLTGDRCYGGNEGEDEGHGTTGSGNGRRSAAANQTVKDREAGYIHITSIVDTFMEVLGVVPSIYIYSILREPRSPL